MDARSGKCGNHRSPWEGLIGQGPQVFNRPYSAEAIAVGRGKSGFSTGIDTSGACVLNQLGFNEKTVQFINDHAHVAQTATNMEPTMCIATTQGVPALNKQLNTHVSLITGNPEPSGQPGGTADINMMNAMDGLRDGTMV